MLEGVNTDTAAPVAEAANNGRAAITWLFASMFDMAKSLDPSVPWGPPYAPAAQYAPLTMYKMQTTTNGYANEIAQSLITSTTANNGEPTGNFVGQLKSSRTVDWSNTPNWRQSVDPVAATCSDDGLSFPHRTLGWKMLKDDLFGIDIGVPGDTDKSDSEVVAAGQARKGTYGTGVAAHDVDSVCLDCHNPTVWGATSSSNHTDDGSPNTVYNDDVIQRGLP